MVKIKKNREKRNIGEVEEHKEKKNRNAWK